MLPTEKRAAAPTIIPHWAPIPTGSKITGISIRRIYELISTGDLRAKKLGRSTLLDVPFALQYVESLPDAVIRMPPRLARRAKQEADVKEVGDASTTP
jgi:hypothetical protein